MVTLIIIVLIGIVVFQYLTIKAKNREIDTQDEMIRQLKGEPKRTAGLKEFD